MSLPTWTATQRFNGIPYLQLPAASIEPFGSDSQGDYWRFGNGGETVIRGLVELPNGGYAGIYNNIPWSSGSGVRPYEEPDQQMIPYIDPSSAVLDSLPIAGDLTGDMTFEGELSSPALTSTASSSGAPTVGSTPLALATAGGFGLNPWLIVAIIVAAFVFFGKDD